MNLNSVMVYGVQMEPNKVLINNENHFNFIYSDIDKVQKEYFNFNITLLTC